LSLCEYGIKQALIFANCEKTGPYFSSGRRMKKAATSAFETFSKWYDLPVDRSIPQNIVSFYSAITSY